MATHDPLEGIDMISGQDPAVVTDPVVTYTVRELLTRIDTKLDLYTKRTEDLETLVRPMAAEHTGLAKRVYDLELAALNKKAVADSRATLWRRVAGTSGVISLVSLGAGLLELLRLH